jgi:dUTP pyrophosphatase
MRVVKILPVAKLPEKAHAEDLGYDLFAAAPETLYPGETKTIRTGIKIQFPPYFGGIIKDRSSVAAKRYLFTVAGVIDSGYRGEILVVMHNASNWIQNIAPQEKIAQLLLTPVVTVSSIDEVTETEWNTIEQGERGERGFGSTGA